MRVKVKIKNRAKFRVRVRVRSRGKIRARVEVRVSVSVSVSYIMTIWWEEFFRCDKLPTTPVHPAERNIYSISFFYAFTFSS